MAKQTRSPSRQGRKLQLRVRAERMDQTRRRIVEAAVGLHETVGPLQTTISAIAERAGVERLTVYRHFPDEPALFRACTEHYFASHQPPDLSAWEAIHDPDERLARGIAELYAYWHETEAMVATILRDAEVAPDRVGAGLREFHAAVVETLSRGGPGPARTGRAFRAALGHATTFHTWRSLVRECGLSDKEAAALMVAFVRRAGPPRKP